MTTSLSSRARMAFAVAASIVPAALISAALVGYDYYDRERARVIRDTTGTARSMVATVDGELAGVRAALRALTTSARLAADDLAGFHKQASDALAEQSFVSIVVLDASGQQRVNTLRPFGAALPAQGNPQELVDIVRTGRPAVTDLFEGPLARRHFVAVGVPVMRAGVLRYALTAGIVPERLAAVLTRQQLPADWVAAIFDTSGTVVARTHQPEAFVGKKGAPALLQKMQAQHEGWVETATLEGTPVVSVFSRSPETGFTVAIGIPERELLRHLLFSMARLAIVAFVLLSIALVLAVTVGGRIVAPQPRD